LPRNKPATRTTFSDLANFARWDRMLRVIR